MSQAIDHKAINTRRILDLMASIETKTRLCFNEATSDALELQCIEAIDGKRKASFVINQLTKIIDRMNEGDES